MADWCLKPRLSESARGRTFSGRELVGFLLHHGVLEINLEYSQRRELLVRPRFSILDERNGRLAGTTEDAFRARPGHQRFAVVFKTGQKTLPRDLNRLLGDRLMVRSAETLDHRAEVRPREGALALVFEFEGAEPIRGGTVNSHKLVLYLYPVSPSGRPGA